ncbi:MAG: response regulator [Pseudomonadota bacterium]
MTTRPLIEIVDDDDDVALSLAALLDRYGYDCRHYPDATTFLDTTGPRSACVLMDVNMPGLSGLEALDHHVRAIGAAPVIMMTGHGDVAMAVDALKRGACDFIEKPFDDSDLVARIETARRVAEPEQEQAVLKKKFSLLTKRETEVMLEVVEGAANKMIAYRLGLSPKTVEIHRARVMEKTGAKSLSHLVRMAMKAGIDPDQARPTTSDEEP